MKLRPEVQWFAERMEKELRANDHKGGWQRDAPLELLVRLVEETAEVLGELKPSTGAKAGVVSARKLLLGAAVALNEAAEIGGVTLKRSYIAELADVANFAMMLADNARSATTGDGK